MFSDRRRLRRWAAQTLLAWLFGLAMGVANACALWDPGHHAAVLDSSVELAGHEHHDLDADHHDGDDGSANCLDFCDKASVGAPKLKMADDGAVVVGLPAQGSGLLGAIEPQEPARSHFGLDRAVLRGGPPLRIALQRLAL